MARLSLHLPLAPAPLDQGVAKMAAGKVATAAVEVAPKPIPHPRPQTQDAGSGSFPFAVALEDSGTCRSSRLRAFCSPFASPGPFGLEPDRNQSTAPLLCCRPLLGGPRKEVLKRRERGRCQER